MDMKEKVISTVLEEYLQANPDLYARLRMESKNMLLESNYRDSEQALVHVNDVTSLEICAYHIQTVLDQLFPTEAPKFQFSEPFSGNFSFNVGSTV
jgi:GTP cyclohydrolase I